MPFHFPIQYDFIVFAIDSGESTKYGLHSNTPSNIGVGGYLTLDEMSGEIIGMVSADLQVARSEGLELPETATVRNNDKYERQITPQEYQELQRLLRASHEEGFPEFVFPTH